MLALRDGQLARRLAWAPPSWSVKCPRVLAVGTKARFYQAGQGRGQIFCVLEFALICTRAGFQGTTHILVIDSSTPPSLSCQRSCVPCQPLGLCQFPSAPGQLAACLFFSLAI